MTDERRTQVRETLLQAERPSALFGELRARGELLPCFAEVAALIGVPQNPAYHAEGDVWNHTMLVLDAAAALRGQAQQPLGFMLAALCHDLGKPQTTERVDGRIRSYGHEEAGVQPARQLLQRLGAEEALTAYVINMVQLHMRPNALAAQGSGVRATDRLFRKSCCPADLVLLAAADRNGRITTQRETDAAAAIYLAERLKLFLEPGAMSAACGSTTPPIPRAAKPRI